MKIFRNVVAILLFVIAGMFVIDAQLMAFINIDYWGEPAESIVALSFVQLTAIGVFSAISVALLVAGAFAGTFRPRIRGVGVVFIVAAAIAGFSVFSLSTILLSPTMLDILDQQNGVVISASMFCLGPGFAAIAITAAAGVGLVLWSRSRSRA